MLLTFQGDGVGGVLTRGDAYGFAPGYELVGLSARLRETLPSWDGGEAHRTNPCGTGEWRGCESIWDEVDVMYYVPTGVKIDSS